MQTASRGVAYRGSDTRRLESVQGSLEAKIVPLGSTTANEPQNLVRLRPNQPGRGDFRVLGSTSWLAAQFRISASHIVAMPCSSMPSTRTVTVPVRKSIGTVRRDLAREKNGCFIRSCASRGAMSPRQCTEQWQLLRLKCCVWLQGHGAVRFYRSSRTSP